jgi:hypothetical protein
MRQPSQSSYWTVPYPSDEHDKIVQIINKWQRWSLQRLKKFTIELNLYIYFSLWFNAQTGEWLHILEWNGRIIRSDGGKCCVLLHYLSMLLEWLREKFRTTGA